MSATKMRSERLDCRITPEHKRLLEQAADKSGLRLSDFVISTLVVAAREVLEADEPIRLSREDWNTLLAALEDDSAPNEKLAQSMEQFAQGTFEAGRYHS